MLVSSGQDGTVKPARTFDMLPTYKQSPGVQGYIPVIAPVTPRLADDPLPRLTPECFTPGPPGSLDDFHAYDVSLLDSTADLTQHAVPLLQLPSDLQLLADAALERLPASAHHAPSPEPSSSVVCPPQDLSREGPFDPYCAAADTGEVPLVPAGLHGCRCNRLRCPLARMSGLQCYNMGHNGHGINLYGVSMTLMEN